MKVIRISIPNINESGYILSKEEISNLIGEVETLLQDGEAGDKLLLTVFDISKEAFDNLPEFTGW